MEAATTARVRASAHRTLASSSRVQILDTLQRSAVPLDVDAVAGAVGLHPNTTREHLDRLAAGGFVASEPQRTGTRGRPRLLYRAVAASAADGTDAVARDHLLRVLLEGYGCALAAPATAAEAAARRLAATSGVPTSDVAAPGAAAGADDVPVHLRQLAALEEHFESLGFEPEADTTAWDVHLRRCPVRRLAQERPDVVCSVHLGLARGVLAAAGGPLEAVGLEPFTGPEHCVLHLGGAPD